MFDSGEMKCMLCFMETLLSRRVRVGMREIEEQGKLVCWNEECN